MALSERDRRELHATVETHLGGRAADLLLAMNEPELPFVLRGEMAELRGEMAELRGELRGEMAELRSELRGEMAELRGAIGELRGEVRAQVPKLVAVNIGAMIGLAGLVLAVEGGRLSRVRQAAPSPGANTSSRASRRSSTCRWVYSIVEATLV